ncbi:MAG: metal ABC transporter permease [Alphaproteobacteria bacterium]|nr:metal ABC transporter permease [Alphaproteobacteria bacterium]
MSSFILNALLAGIGLSAILAPVGCFVVWRRISFIGDALSHSAITGVAVAILFGFLPFWGVVLTATGVGLLLSFLRNLSWLPADTWLSIIAHSLLALGLVIFSYAGGGLVDLQSYLFGDILTVSTRDIRNLYMGLFVLGGIFILIWRSLLLITISADLAEIEGISIRWCEVLFTVIVALLVALGVKLVGALLLTAMMIIPAAAARSFSKTPMEMTIASSLFGVASVILGIYGSVVIDVPAAPFIVLSALMLFILAQVGFKLKAIFLP